MEMKSLEGKYSRTQQLLSLAPAVRLLCSSQQCHSRSYSALSAGNLLHHGFGSTIDKHDVVIRMNSAPTRGYEQDVGRHTHVRMVWSGALRAARRVMEGETVVLTCPSEGPCAWRHRSDISGLHEVAVLDNSWKADLHRISLATRGKVSSMPCGLKAISSPNLQSHPLANASVSVNWICGNSNGSSLFAAGGRQAAKCLRIWCVHALPKIL